MTDEPTNPQQIIDDATNALGQTVVKPPKKKGGKGMLIGMLLFLILTLPVAVYYGSQQITDIRSRAAGRCEQRMVAGLCINIECIMYTSQTSCTSGTGTCCRWVTVTAPTATPTPPTLCPKDCVSSQSQCKSGTQVGGVGYGDCGMGEYCCDIAAPATTAPAAPTPPPGGNTPTPGGGGACTNRAKDGTWHGCDYIHNSGGTGPVASGCENNPSKGNDYNNCGGQPCCQFTFKCGVYCLDQACARSACYDDIPAATATPQPTNTPRPTATNTPANTSAPGTCDASCDTDSNCESGLSCYSVTGVKRCRKAACPDRSNCECPLAESTATPTTRSVIAEAPIATATQRPTPKVPVSGAIDVKAIVITVASVFLLALGLIL